MKRLLAYAVAGALLGGCSNTGLRTNLGPLPSAPYPIVAHRTTCAEVEHDYGPPDHTAQTSGLRSEEWDKDDWEGNQVGALVVYCDRAGTVVDYDDVN